MALHNQLGALGEEVAAHYLSQLEYRLLERNWRTGHLEVDIIADYYGEIVFVEVKTRSYEAEYTALEAVDQRKSTLGVLPTIICICTIWMPLVASTL